MFDEVCLARFGFDRTSYLTSCFCFFEPISFVLFRRAELTEILCDSPA